MEEAWEFFSSPRNLATITPPDFGFRVVHLPDEAMHEGQIIPCKVKVAPALWLSWVSEIKNVEPGRAFVDEQRSGPYRFWQHHHSFEPIEGGVLVKDLVRYALPFGPIGEIAHVLFARGKLRRVFAFRRAELERKFGTL